MAIVAHTHPFVIGVDTHAQNHALAILAAPTGEVIDDAQFPATAAGLARAVSWAGRRTGGDLDVLWVIEGVGTYGARLARAAADSGYPVVEAARMNARANRGVAKSDPLDARRIAQAVLPLDLTALRQPRADDGVRAAVRVLVASRDHMSSERTAAVNALTALLRVADQPNPGFLRQHCPPSNQPRRRPPPEPGPTHGHRHSHPDGPPHPRLRRTQDAEGRTPREIRRCLKRYLARQIYRHLNAAAQNTPSTT